MTDKAKVEGAEKKASSYIGERCKLLRNEMGLTQKQLVECLSAKDQATISNIENKGSMGEFLIYYLEFLYHAGYSLNWIVVKDNSNISKKVPSEIGNRYKKIRTEKVRELANVIVEKTSDLEKLVQEIETDYSDTDV